MTCSFMECKMRIKKKKTSILCDFHKLRTTQQLNIKNYMINNTELLKSSGKFDEIGIIDIITDFNKVDITARDKQATDAFVAGTGCCKHDYERGMHFSNLFIRSDNPVAILDYMMTLEGKTSFEGIKEYIETFYGTKVDDKVQFIRKNLDNIFYRNCSKQLDEIKMLSDKEDLEVVIPDSPRSRLQRYRTTEAGTRHLSFVK